MSNGAKGDSDPWAIIGVFFLVGISCLLIWHYAHTQMSWAVLWSAYWSAYLLNMIQHALIDMHAPHFIMGLLVDPRDYEKILMLANQIPTRDMSQVTYNELERHLMITGIVARILFPPFALYWIVQAYRKTKAARRQFTYNIASLAKHNLRFFPHIKPAILSNLLKSNPDKGYFRREDSPIRFCIKNKLIQFYRRDYKQSIVGDLLLASLDPADKDKSGVGYIPDDLDNHISQIHRSCVFNEALAKEVFVKQLGAPWTSSNDLPVLVRGLYAALIAIACSDKKQGFALLEQFNRTWVHPTPKDPSVSFDVKGVDDAIKKYEKNEIIVTLLKEHRYINTMMVAALYAARRKGKVLCSHFLWLKIADRTLWYALNQAGGQTAWSEAAGVAGHYLAEKIVGRGLDIPYVDEALRGLTEFLDREEGWLYSADYERSIIR